MQIILVLGLKEKFEELNSAVLQPCMMLLNKLYSIMRLLHLVYKIKYLPRDSHIYVFAIVQKTYLIALAGEVKWRTILLYYVWVTVFSPNWSLIDLIEWLVLKIHFSELFTVVDMSRLHQKTLIPHLHPQSFGFHCFWKKHLNIETTICLKSPCN